MPNLKLIMAGIVAFLVGLVGYFKHKADAEKADHEKTVRDVENAGLKAQVDGSKALSEGLQAEAKIQKPVRNKKGQFQKTEPVTPDEHF